ncbi:MAG TPA: hypothetical protein VK654_13720 [Nitrospirota bacterium]|nr:hypothetical protein [Nitrospirota bacterium]
MTMKTMLISLLLGFGCMVQPTGSANADEPKLDVKSSATIRDILADAVGKRVTVRFASGEELEGAVVKVGDSVVHLAKLSRRDFYDAVVRIDTISAVILRVRDR